MIEELDAIEKNETWELLPRPTGVKPIGFKWIFKVKKNPKREIVRHKARFVAKGYSQKARIDYEEVFAPFARMEMIRTFIALAVQGDWEIHHMDANSNFFNGLIKETIYVKQVERQRTYAEIDEGTLWA